MYQGKSKMKTKAKKKKRNRNKLSKHLHGIGSNLLWDNLLALLEARWQVRIEARGRAAWG
jgi:hypothetical protein